MCVQVVFQRLRSFGEVAGRRVGISGLGPAGLVAVQMARAHGARSVVGIDPLLKRRAMALMLGADETVAPDVANWPGLRTAPRALDVAIDCTGLSAAVEFLLERTHGAVAVFGVLREDVVMHRGTCGAPGSR